MLRPTVSRTSRRTLRIIDAFHYNGIELYFKARIQRGIDAVDDPLYIVPFADQAKNILIQRIQGNIDGCHAGIFHRNCQFFQ